MAGSLKLDGNEFLVKEGGQFKITNSELKLKSSGNTVVDSSGNAVISEANGVVTMSDKMVPANSFMFRNKIINGGMKISQRGTSFTFAHDGTSNGYHLDRFKIFLHNTDEYDCTVSQYSMTSAEINTTGHTKALKLLTGTAESAIANDESVRFEYVPESQDLQDFLHGTSSAKTATLSFWVKSSVTGDFGFNLYRYGTARTINLSYTINTANTWEKKIVSIVGDTSGNPLPNDNTAGFILNWQIAAGSDFHSSSSSSWTDYATTRAMNSGKTDAVITTAGADWYLTGVQLEIGSSATPFEHRPAGMELSLCQRYCQKLRKFETCKMRESDRYSTGTYHFVTEMRATPTIPARTQDPDNLSITVSGIDTLGFLGSLNRPGDGYGGTVNGGGVAEAEL